MECASSRKENEILDKEKKEKVKTIEEQIEKTIQKMNMKEDK